MGSKKRVQFQQICIIRLVNNLNMHLFGPWVGGIGGICVHLRNWSDLGWIGRPKE